MTITLEHYQGAGIVYIDGRDIGNTADVNIAIETEEKTVPNFRGGGGNSASLSRITGVNLSMNLYDFNNDNLALALRGINSAVAATPITDEVLTTPAALDVLLETANIIDTAVAPVVTGPSGTPTYVLDTDYEVKAGGIYVLASGSITVSSTIEVDYTPEAGNALEALLTSGAEVKVIVDGVNDAESGKPWRLSFHKWKPSPTAGLSAIGEDYGSFELTGEVLLDTTKNGTTISQYFKREAAS